MLLDAGFQVFGSAVEVDGVRLLATRLAVD
jgi:hypothetical protein